MASEKNHHENSRCHDLQLTRHLVNTCIKIWECDEVKIVLKNHLNKATIQFEPAKHKRGSAHSSSLAQSAFRRIPLRGEPSFRLVKIWYPGFKPFTLTDFSPALSKKHATIMFIRAVRLYDDGYPVIVIFRHSIKKTVVLEKYSWMGCVG